MAPQYVSLPQHDHEDRSTTLSLGDLSAASSEDWHQKPSGKLPQIAFFARSRSVARTHYASAIGILCSMGVGWLLAHKPSNTTPLGVTASIMDWTDTAYLPIRRNTTAVCVTGQVRGWPDLAIAQSFKTNLLDVWNSDTRVYPVLSWPERNWEGTDETLGIDATVIVSPNQMEPHANKCTWPVSMVPGPATWETGNFWVQQRKNQLCYNYVTNIEQMQGWRFDYFLRARADGFYSSPLPLTYATAPRDAISVFDYSKHITAISDHFAIMPRHLAEIYFNAVNAYDSCIDPSVTQEEAFKWCNWVTTVTPVEGRDYPPECLLSRWLQIHQVSVNAFDYKTFKLWRSAGSQKHFNFTRDLLEVFEYTDGRPLK